MLIGLLRSVSVKAWVFVPKNWYMFSEIRCFDLFVRRSCLTSETLPMCSSWAQNGRYCQVYRHLPTNLNKLDTILVWKQLMLLIFLACSYNFNGHCFTSKIRTFHPTLHLQYFDEERTRKASEDLIRNGSDYAYAAIYNPQHERQIFPLLVPFVTANATQCKLCKLVRQEQPCLKFVYDSNRQNVLLGIMFVE